jgi:phage portal protein BeeE
LALQTYQSKFFANGGRPTGVLQHAGMIPQASADRIQQYWKEYRAGVEQFWCLKAVSTSTRSACRTTKRKNRGADGRGRTAYVSSTLDPIYQAWEDSIRRDLLTNRQFTTFTAQFDRNALIRSDPQAQHAALATGIAAGFYSQNDAQRMLGLNPIPNGDVYRVNAAMAPTNGTP